MNYRGPSLRLELELQPPKSIPAELAPKFKTLDELRAASFRRDLIAYAALGLVEFCAEALTRPDPATPEYIAERIIERAKDFRAQKQAEALA